MGPLAWLRPSLRLGLLVVAFTAVLSLPSAAVDTDTTSPTRAGSSGNGSNAVRKASQTAGARDNGVDSAVPAILPSMEDSVKELLVEQDPCEAGFPCQANQWCSPSRSVCRPCEDVWKWCNDSLLILRTYPTCVPYCFQALLDRSETCEREKEGLQQQLNDNESAVHNPVTTTGEAERRYERDKEDDRKGQDSIIAGLAVGLAFTVLWALAATGLSYWFWRQRQSRHHRIDTEEPDAPQRKRRPAEDNAMAPLVATEEEGKAPVQDNTLDTGEYYGTCGLPPAPVPGDADVVPNN